MTRRTLPRGLLLLSLLALAPSVFARGVTPYLPLNLDPAMQNAVELVLILGDEPVLARPIPAALVQEALPKACRVDRPLCDRVRHYLRRYMHSNGVEFASVSVGVTGGHSNITLPNAHGEKAQSPFQIAAAGYVQPNSHILLNLGGDIYKGRVTPTGTMLSLGFDWAQLDIGYRDHWWSPLTDSSMLISTEAPTMPSITLSNYQPLTRLGLQYEIFVAQMSQSSRIQLPNFTLTRGHPKMGGVRVSIEPVSGWGLSLQRLLIWGGGAAGGESFTNVMQAFFNPSKAQSTGFNAGTHVVGKQEASVSSEFIFPGRVPFAVYIEYAGNDTADGKNYLLGKPDISAGIQFPHIGPFDLTYEVDSFSPSWYVHPASPVQTGYLDGITNYGASIGNWFGDQRVLATSTTLADQVGGQSNMLRIGWTPPFGGYMQLRLRSLSNEAQTIYATYPYRNEYMGSLRYTRPWHGYAVGAALQMGSDVFGAHYIRLEGTVTDGSALFSGDSTGAGAFEGKRPKGDWLFVQTGVNYYRMLVNPMSTERFYTRWAGSPDLTIGALRRISKHQDIGVALDADAISGRLMLGLRMIDYRYRFTWPIAFHIFAGAARYSLATPAYGLYLGAGFEWRKFLPNWDLGLDFRNVIDANRQRDLPTDPQGGIGPYSFTSTYSYTLYVSRRF